MHRKGQIPQRPRNFLRLFFAGAIRTKIWIERRLAQVFAAAFDEHPNAEQVHRARWVPPALVRSNRERFGGRRPSRRN